MDLEQEEADEQLAIFHSALSERRCCSTTAKTGDPNAYRNDGGDASKQQPVTADKSGNGRLWKDLFNFAQEVEQAYHQFYRSNGIFQPPQLDTSGPYHTAWFPITFRLNELIDRTRSILEFIREQIRQHEAVGVLDPSDEIDVPHDRRLSYEVRHLYHQYMTLIAPQQFLRVCYGYKQYILIPDEDSQHLEKMTTITGKMYLWSRIEAMMSEWAEEDNKIVEEISRAQQELQRDAGPEGLIPDDCAPDSKKSILANEEDAGEGDRPDPEDGSTQMDSDFDDEEDKVEKWDPTPDRRRYRACQKFLDDVTEVIGDRMKAELEEFVNNFDEDEDEGEHKIDMFKHMPPKEVIEGLQRCFQKVRAKRMGYDQPDCVMQ